MKESKQLTRKRLVLIGCGFVSLTLIALVLLCVGITHSSLRETYNLAQETATFLEQTVEKYGNVDQGNSARSLQSMLDKARGFAYFLPSDNVVVDDDLINEYIRAEHVGGMMVLDGAAQLVAQADLDDADGYSLWGDLIQSQAVRNVIGYHDDTFSDVVTLGGDSYNVVVAPYGDGAVVLYEAIRKSTVDPYEYSVADLLTSNTFHKDPTVIMVQDGKIVSSNDPDITTETFDESPQRDATIEWKDGELTPVTFNGQTWYGLRSTYKDYRFFVLYSEDEVFAGRAALIGLGFSVYLAACVAILVVRGYLSKRNLQAVQKQMRIINAISATYETTFLLHLDTMKMESIKMKPDVAKGFSEHPEPRDFFDYVCRDVVCPESRDALRDMMDASTLEERLRGCSYLGVDVKTNQGGWYSLQVMPQRRDEAGRLTSVLVATRDISAMKRAEELSFRDKLTGLHNRNYLESRHGELMRIGDKPVTVVMADCNYLKRTNDTLGHEWGDKLLQRVAAVLREKVPEDCLVMRLGGDEFLLVCPHTDADRAALIVAGVKEGLSKAGDEDLTLSVSFGARTVAEGEEVSFEEAYKAADQAMYREKRAAHAAACEAAADVGRDGTSGR